MQALPTIELDLTDEAFSARTVVLAEGASDQRAVEAIARLRRCEERRVGKVDAGRGVVDSPTSRGASGVGGIGVKLFAGNAVAIRLDARDRVYRQELLEEHFLVNDVALTMGLSLFLPLRN